MNAFQGEGCIRFFLADWIGTLVAVGTKTCSSHRMIKETIFKIFFSETTRPTAYILMVPFINPANEAPGVQTMPRPGDQEFP